MAGVGEHEHRSEGYPCPAMRPPAEFDVLAPPFPRQAEWVNVATLRMDQQRGRPGARRVLGLLPRQLAAHAAVPARRGTSATPTTGLRVIGIHSAGFEPSRDADAVRAAVARLEIEYPVLIDAELESWDAYGIQGWPSRYLWDGEQRLVDFHVGEGGYAEAERAIQQLLGVEREPLAPVRPEDAPGALLEAQTEDQPARTADPTRPAACGRCCQARATWSRTGASSRSSTPARTR